MLRIHDGRELVRYRENRVRRNCRARLVGLAAEPQEIDHLVRTFTDRHGLKDLCRDLLGVEMSKQQQTSDWGADNLSDQQLEYAASDVLYLHDLKKRLDQLLVRQNRTGLADKCFEFLPTRAELDLAGWSDEDIFAHS